MIDRETLRNFMQISLRTPLFYTPEIQRSSLCDHFEMFIQRRLDLDDRIDLVNAIMEACHDFVSLKCLKNNPEDRSFYTIHFELDPANREDWDKAMDAIYTA